MQIGIAQVLQNLNVLVDDTTPVVFQISFVKADGTVKTVARATADTKVSTKVNGGFSRSQFGYNLKAKHSVLIRSLDENKTMTVKVPLIIRFNNTKVFH